MTTLAQAGPGQKRRILVVDDNRYSAISMTIMLKLLGNEVRTAHDGIEAVERWASATYGPDWKSADATAPRT